jgi:hypothetical protein
MRQFGNNARGGGGGQRGGGGGFQQGGGGAAGGGNRSGGFVKKGPYRLIITSKDLERNPLSWGNISVTTVNGTPHAHALGDFADPNGRGDMASSMEIVLPGSEDNDTWVRVVDDCVALKLVDPKLRDSYIVRSPNIRSDVRLTNEMSSIVVLPGQKTGFSIKVNTGLSKGPGTTPEKTLHHKITEDLMTAVRLHAAAYLDANPAFKRDLLLKGMKDTSKINDLLSRPTLELIKPVLMAPMYKEDVVDEGGNIIHEVGSLIEHESNVVSFRPTITYLDEGGNKSTKLWDGCFAFNHVDTADTDYPNAIWRTPTIVPVMDDNGVVVGQKLADCIDDLRYFMYCKKDNLDQEQSMHVGEKAFFTVSGNVLKYGVPMLHSSNGNITLSFFAKKMLLIKKIVKSGGNAVAESVAKINTAALMNDFDDEVEDKDEAEHGAIGSGVGQQSNGDSDDDSYETARSKHLKRKRDEPENVAGGTTFAPDDEGAATKAIPTQEQATADGDDDDVLMSAPLTEPQIEEGEKDSTNNKSKTTTTSNQKGKQNTNGGHQTKKRRQQ